MNREESLEEIQEMISTNTPVEEIMEKIIDLIWSERADAKSEVE